MVFYNVSSRPLKKSTKSFRRTPELKHRIAKQDVDIDIDAELEQSRKEIEMGLGREFTDPKEFLKALYE